MGDAEHGAPTSRFTELNLVFALKSDTPQEIVDVLLFMTRQDDKPPNNIPTHPLFEGTQWTCMLCETGADAYSNARLELSANGWYLVSIRCNCENAAGEVGKFVDWIMPYVHASQGDFKGYRRAEHDEAVTVLAYPNSSITQVVPGEVIGDPV